MERRESHWWMRDSDFLKRSGFFNLPYLTKLMNHLYYYISGLPFPVIATYDRRHTPNRLYLKIGEETAWFEIDEHISYDDFKTLLHGWLFKFFPKYKYEFEDEVSYSDDEIKDMVTHKNISMDDALLLTKKVSKVETGVITFINLKQDEFHFLKNGKESIRRSGSILNIYPISHFLENFRKKVFEGENEEKLRNYILKNSEEIKKVTEEKPKIINYDNKKMLNFFIINFPYLKMERVNKSPDGDYFIWGNFYIKFLDNDIKDSCFNYLKEMREEKGIKLPISNI